MHKVILSQKTAKAVVLLKEWGCRVALGALLLCSGCIGPRYSDHALIICGKPAPVIHSPHDPALQANLSTNPWPRQPFLGRAAEIGTTLFKDARIQGWKDFHLHARATGISVLNELSSGPYLTTDLRLESLTIQDIPLPLAGPKYMRVVVFTPRVPVDAGVHKQTNSVVIAQGKLVWNYDGWFEIHPQKTGDLVLGPR